MTGHAVVEVGAVTVATMVTTTAAAISLDAGTVVSLVVGVISGAVAGWFAASLTTERRLTRIETLLEAYFNNERRR